MGDDTQFLMETYFNKTDMSHGKMSSAKTNNDDDVQSQYSEIQQSPKQKLKTEDNTIVIDDSQPDQISDEEESYNNYRNFEPQKNQGKQQQKTGVQLYEEQMQKK